MAENAVEALGWRLNVDEVKQLDACSAEGGSKSYLVCVATMVGHTYQTANVKFASSKYRPI